MKKLRENLFSISIIIIVFAIFVIIIPIIALKNEVPIEIALKLLQVLISWPLIVLTIVLLIFYKFHDAIDSFLRNLRVKLPSGAEIQSQTPNATELTPKPPSGSAILTKEQQDQIAKFISELQQQSNLKQGEINRLGNELQKAYLQMFHWKHEYLKLFFVPNTKSVLKWFSSLNIPMSRQSFHNIWQFLIPNPNQRDIILEVLLQNNMLFSPDGIQIEITEEGKYFLKYIGIN